MVENVIGMEAYSAIKITNAKAESNYGTRSHALILVDFQNNVTWVEKDLQDGVWATRRIESKILD